MGYDRGDSFPSDFEQNGDPFGSKSKGKLSVLNIFKIERKTVTTITSHSIRKKMEHQFSQCDR